MEQQQEAHRPEPPRDPATAAGCGTESTRTESNAGCNKAWTNEKHNSYLNALEASFVHQLQSSLASRKKRSNISADYVSDQFAVLQGGFWRKKIFEKDSLLPYGVAASHVAVKSSKLCQFLTSAKLSNIQSRDSPENVIVGSDTSLLSEKSLLTHNLTSSKSLLLCHLGDEDTVGSLAEGSDQNFVNEDQVEKTNNFSSPKRLKKVAAYAPPEEQIVPSPKFVGGRSSY